MTESHEFAVLFVCMGNICRSPTAEGVMRRFIADAGVADRVYIDSAGTHAYHVGKAPDERAVSAAQARGIDIGEQRARKVEVADFESFDYILAMDAANLQILREMQPAGSRARVELLSGSNGCSICSKRPTRHCWSTWSTASLDTPAPATGAWPVAAVLLRLLVRRPDRVTCLGLARSGFPWQ